MDWMAEPMASFGPRSETDADGRTTGRVVFSHGEGAAPRLVMCVSELVGDAYFDLLSEADYARGERTGAVPVIRGGVRGHEDLDGLALEDLPAILETLAVLEGEAGARSADEAARLEESRKTRRNARARERRKRKGLGEW